MSRNNAGYNIGNLLMAAGAAAVLGAAIFAPQAVRIANFAGVIAAGAGFFFHKLFS